MRTGREADGFVTSSERHVEPTEEGVDVYSVDSSICRLRFLPFDTGERRSERRSERRGEGRGKREIWEEG